MVRFTHLSGHFYSFRHADQEPPLLDFQDAEVEGKPGFITDIHYTSRNGGVCVINLHPPKGLLL
jgi:hypothetical protein